MTGRISELTALTGVNATSADLVEVVDVSDTSMAASGTNKKMSLAELGVKFGGGITIPRLAGRQYSVAQQRGIRSALTQNVVASGLGQTWLAWLPGQGHKLASISVDVSGAGEAGSKIRLGVYTANAGVAINEDAIVGSLVIDCGQFDGSIVGAKVASGLAIPIPSEGLWLACSFQDWTTTCPGITALDIYKAPGIEPLPFQAPGHDFWSQRGGALAFWSVTGAFPVTPPVVYNNIGGIGWLLVDFVVTYSA